MFIILGATGHIGNGLVSTLISERHRVLAVAHSEKKAEQLRSRGAEVETIDIHNAKALHAVFNRGKRAFLLNPPAPPSSNTDSEEHRSMRTIVEALRGTKLEKVVLQSTYGAQPGDRVGDLSVLFDFEEALRSQEIPVTVLRAAFYMSNWEGVLEPARNGSIPSVYPGDLKLPMVAPADIARAAAKLLLAAPETFAIHFVEGPQPYIPHDVARAFSQALRRPVNLDEIPRDKWLDTYRKLGFSPEAAEAYSRMTAATVDAKSEPQIAPLRGSTSLAQYVNELVSFRVQS